LRVVFSEKYRVEDGINLLKRAQIECVQFEDRDEEQLP
jgi:dCMP deaminase